MDIERFILEYGAWSYLVTLVWTFFEGETFVLLAGFAAARGSLSAPLLILAAATGELCRRPVLFLDRPPFRAQA